MSLYTQARKEFNKSQQTKDAFRRSSSIDGRRTKRTPINKPPPEEWEVEDILEAKEEEDEILYKVRWVGYEEETWEPRSCLNTISFSWSGEPVESHGRKHYQSFRRLREVFRIGDSISIFLGQHRPLGLGLIQSLWEDRRGTFMSCQWFYRREDVLSLSEKKQRLSKRQKRGPSSSSGSSGSTFASSSPSTPLLPNGSQIQNREIFWSFHSTTSPDIASLDFAKVKIHSSSSTSTPSNDAYFYRFGFNFNNITFYELEFDEEGNVIKPPEHDLSDSENGGDSEKEKAPIKKEQEKVPIKKEQEEKAPIKKEKEQEVLIKEKEEKILIKKEKEEERVEKETSSSSPTNKLSLLNRRKRLILDEDE